MAAKTPTVVRSPMVVRPRITAWASMATPSPSVTSRPMIAYGPMRTSAPRRAPSSTIAVGWMDGMRSASVHDHRSDHGLCHFLSVNARFARELPDASAVAELAHVILHCDAGEHRPAELALVDSHE